jgi:nitric oxide reductase subunit B
VKDKIPFAFITLGLLALLGGAFIGCLLGFQYVSPEFLKDEIPFNRLRPMHVSTVVGWIILTATGGVYYYISKVHHLKIYAPKLAKTHLILFILCMIGIYISYLTGNMGGREYLAYLPLISIPVFLGWVLFGINYFKTLKGKIKGWPVYLWMWGTGIVFMLIHFTEAHLWLLPYFRENFVRDLTVQWKSYGSFVGSWNMLVYGTAIFLMSRITGDDKIGRGKKAFFFFFLGLSNLMMGWAHHTYVVPTQPWVRYLAYAMSMTEWIIIISIIQDFRKSIGKEKKQHNNLAYKFLMATDVWVFINLLLALFISIPAFNMYTHGTLITVAHSMGTTIGINTTILLASVLFIANSISKNTLKKSSKQITFGYWVFNVSFLVFFTCLLIGGIMKGIWQYEADPVPFGQMQQDMSSYMYLFLASGIGILFGLLNIIYPMLHIFLVRLMVPKNSDIEHSDLDG